MIINGKKIYAGVLDIPAATSGTVTVAHKEFPAGHVMTSGTLRTALYGQKSERIKFTMPTRWHELSEEGYGVWMTDLPVEQRQHDSLLRTATGHVLVGGLGLGYAVVALSMKPRVKSITVIEKNADVIALVGDATRARVTALAEKFYVYPPKIDIVQADLFEWLESQSAEQATIRIDRVGKRVPPYSWGFFDIWQGDGETTFHDTVVPLRKAAHGIVRSLECWNEDIMRGQLRQGLEYRWLFLTKHSEEVLVTLEELCNPDPHGGIWMRWAAPFWRWYRDVGVKLPDDVVKFVMDTYALDYGRPERGDGQMILDIHSGGTTRGRT